MLEQFRDTLARCWRLSLVDAAWREENSWKGMWIRSIVGCRFPFCLEQSSSIFSCFQCAPRTERGGELLPKGLLGNELVSMSWEFVCTSCYMLRVGLRAGADMLKRKWAISSRPCHTVCCVCTGCLVSYGSRPEVVGTGDSESMEVYTQEGPGCSLFEWF